MRLLFCSRIASIFDHNIQMSQVSQHSSAKDDTLMDILICMIRSMVCSWVETCSNSSGSHAIPQYLSLFFHSDNSHSKVKSSPLGHLDPFGQLVSQFTVGVLDFERWERSTTMFSNKSSRGTTWALSLCACHVCFERHFLSLKHLLWCTYSIS